MVKIEYKICVVTVTYGDRWKFLKQVLKRVLAWKEVSHVVVVNNASSYSVSAAAIQLDDTRIQVIDEEENLGSAGGYKRALERAHSLDCDFVFLLDDDNLPSEDCLAILLDNWDRIKSNKSKALFCLREDRWQHIKIAKGESPYRFYLTANNFLGFSLFRIPYNQFYKLKDRLVKKGEYEKRAKMPYVPYGGLFLNKDLLTEIGYPDERFYLYVDDSEYTYRITSRGGTIWLIPGCRITDIDRSQGIGYKGGIFRSVLLDCWSFRTYYHVRNMLYFNNKVAVKNKLVFNINKGLYLTWLKVLSIFSSKKIEYLRLKEAINDGLTKNLGRKYFH